MTECNFCKESLLKVGEKGPYRARVIFRIGNSDNGWFATLSPKTAGDPDKDFSIQLMPVKHLINFSQMNEDEELAKNYGLAFSKISVAISKVMLLEGQDKKKVPIGTYGKCKHEDEHIHMKLFPWRNGIGQPYTVDSSYLRKDVHKSEDGEEFVKMKPVKKEIIEEARYNYLVKLFIDLLK